MHTKDYKQWCDLFIFLEVTSKLEPMSLRAFLSVSKRFNIEPSTLASLLQFYSFNSPKNAKE